MNKRSGTTAEPSSSSVAWSIRGRESDSRRGVEGHQFGFQSRFLSFFQVLTHIHSVALESPLSKTVVVFFFLKKRLRKKKSIQVAESPLEGQANLVDVHSFKAHLTHFIYVLYIPPSPPSFFSNSNPTASCVFFLHNLHGACQDKQQRRISHEYENLSSSLRSFTPSASYSPSSPRYTTTVLCVLSQDPCATASLKLIPATTCLLTLQRTRSSASGSDVFFR